MAFATVQLVNENTGGVKEAPVGVSWTVLFFGPFPPLFRGDWKWFILILILAIFTWTISNLFFMFIYNKFSLKELISNGYRVKKLTNITEGSLGRELGLDADTFMLKSEKSPLKNEERPNDKDIVENEEGTFTVGDETYKQRTSAESKGGLAAEISDLKRLHDDGTLTDEEFKEAKANILKN